MVTPALASNPSLPGVPTTRQPLPHRAHPPGITDYRALRGGNESSCSTQRAMLVTRQRRSGRHSSARYTEYYAPVQNALPCCLAHPEACNTLDGSDDKRKFEPCKPPAMRHCRIQGLWAGRGKRFRHSPPFPSSHTSQAFWGPTLIPPSPGSRKDTSKRHFVTTLDRQLLRFSTDRLNHCQPLGQSDAGILRPLWTPSSPSPWAACRTQW